MSRFDKHIFICENKRDAAAGRECCFDKGATEIRTYFKERIKILKLSHRMRANGAGCLDACEYGSAMVVYPEGIWYGAVTKADVDEIIESHLIGGIPVERLIIKAKAFSKD